MIKETWYKWPRSDFLEQPSSAPRTASYRNPPGVFIIFACPTGYRLLEDENL
jgi:hypothetical protein